MRRRKSIDERARDAVARWRDLEKWAEMRGLTLTDRDLESVFVVAIHRAIAADRRKRGERG